VEVTHLSAGYHELLTRANKLAEKFLRVGNKSKDYNDAVERAKKWLNNTEPKVSKMVSEPIGAEPKVVEEQQQRARTLLSEIVANGKLIDDAKHAASSLLASLGESQMSPQEKKQIEQTPIELQARYDAIRSAMSDWCTDLDTALAQSQGVQDSLANLASWLDGAENQLKSLQTPASLIRERLDEQIKQLRQLQADVDNHESSIQKMYQAAQAFVQSAKNVRESKKIESKVKDVQSKFQALQKAAASRGQFLNEVSAQLDGFTASVDSFDNWFLQIIEILESKEMLTMDADESSAQVDEIARKKDQKRPEFEEMIKNGKNLIGKKDVTDINPCKDTIAELEEKWRELTEILGERQNQNRARKQSLNAFEAMKEQVTSWLSKMEYKIDHLSPIAVDLEILKQQMEELKPISQEYVGFSKNIEKFNEIALQYDALLRGSLENGAPGSRRQSVSPRKSSMTPNGSARRSSSQISKIAGQGPRRDSSMPSFQEQTPIQSLVADVNTRYDEIGIRLSTRERDLTNMREEIKVHLDNLKQIGAFLEKQEKNLPKESIPSDKKESDKQIRLIKSVLDQLYENQPLLDETKVAIKDVLKRSPDAPGADQLDAKLNEVVVRWKTLQDKCKAKIDLLDELKEFHDIHDSLNNWLNSKGRLMNVLGPIPSDPRLVQNQLTQVAVMREEFSEKLPQKNKFNTIGEDLLAFAGSSADMKNVNGKLENINNKWNDLLGQLDERQRALDDLVGPTRDFLNLSNKLQDNLGKVSEDLDDVVASKADAQQKLKALDGIGKNLDGQRPLWADVETIGNQLQSILTDPAAKSEVKGKLAAVEKQFNNCQKKLENALAELENASREGKEFDSDCERTQEMLKEFEALLSENLSVSAEKDVLKQQVDDFEPLYHEIMSKEHTVIMLINKGKTIMANSTKADAQRQQKMIDSIEKQWQKIKKIALERQKRLHTAMEFCKKFFSAFQKFLPWLEKSEVTLSKMSPISFLRVETLKQEKELQAFRNDVNRHASEFEGVISSGTTFVDSCDVDKEIVNEDLALLKERWDQLNFNIHERAAALADLLAKLTDFNDDVRDVVNNLNRVEDKLAGLDKAPQDEKTLEGIKGLLEDTKDLEKLFNKVQHEGEDLINDAERLNSDGSYIHETLDDLGDRLGNLRDRLEGKANDLKNAGNALANFNDKMKDLNGSIALLEDELNKMKPIARDLVTLHKQLDEVQGFIEKIIEKQDLVEETAEAAQRLIEQGIASSPKEMKDMVTNMAKQLEKINSKAHSREKDVDAMVIKVQAFYDLYQGIIKDIQVVIQEEKSFGSVGGDTESIKSQQEEVKKFQRGVVDPLGKEVEKTNKTGQGLIQTAASGVNTSGLEKDLEKLNDLWNTLKKNLSDREKKLDQGLLQSGKYQEALAGLFNWFDEMDDMMSNQKSPSSDYKVVKAQVQEQKFVAKLLGDRKGAIDSLIKMGKEIAASADPSERKNIEAEIIQVEKKYEDLNKKCRDRMDLLEDAMQLAKDYQDKLGPLEKWLDQAEKKVKEMETVPTDEDKIQKRINEHDKLHKDIVSKQPSFDELADIANTLMDIVSEEDAQGLAGKIEDLTKRYNTLLNNSEDVGNLLRDSMAGLKNLVHAYEDLLNWMEKTEKKLSKFKVLSVFTEKLLDQMNELHNVTEDIVEHQKDVENVLSIGSELLKNIASEEALQLKEKLDSLQRKYNDLATKAANLLKNAQEMMPLVQSFHQSHNRLSEWLTGVEETLQSLDNFNLEHQEVEIKKLEKDIIQNRPLLESVNISGPQLCQMSPGDGAKTIEDLVTRDNRRFDAVCEQIQRRSERIQLSKQRSAEVVHDIDELLEWFREAEHQIREADPPSSEPDVIRVQLKNHKQLNDDISSQKGRVREVLSNAKKVLRESAPTSEMEQVKEKMEDLKETMELVIKLSSDRLSILEQALPLSEHFYETHNELTDWLEDIEREAMNQLMPGMRPDQIAKQQEINRSLLQSVQDHKPVLDRLNKTGGALLRLIVEDDAYRIQDIIETDNQRYNALKLGLRERQQALEEAMQECSQFTDKLDGMLNALANTADQVNNAEPISGHPEKIKEQMEDNNAIIDDLAKKESAFESVKQAAADIIEKAPNKNDPAIKEIKKKLDKLNNLWDHILNATQERSDSLDNALALAETFWAELQQVMEKLKNIQDDLASQDPPGVEPNEIEAQKAELKAIKKSIDQTKPAVDKCRQTGKDLMGVVGDSEKPEIRHHIDDLDNSWDNITSLFAKREKNLLDAMEKAMEFHNILQAILDFLAKSERNFDNLGPVASDIEAIKKQIDQLKNFKNEVDPWMVKVEALNRYGTKI